MLINQGISPKRLSIYQSIEHLPRCCVEKKECPHLVEDLQPLVVAGVGREDESEPREHEGSQQDLGAENEDEIVQQLLRGNVNL